MKAFRDYSIGVKFLSTLIITTLFAAALMAGSLFFRELAVFTESTENELAGLSRIVGANCSSAMVFDDPDTAQEILSSLKHRPKVLAAAVYNNDGDIFAQYTREDRPDITLPDRPSAPGGHQTESGDIVWLETIREHENKTGDVYILGDRTLFFDQIESRMIVMLITLLPALSFGMIFLGLFLHRVFKRPLLHLANTADEVTKNNNYSIRAKKLGDDELGHLVDQFNLMLAKVETAHDDLDQRGQVLQRELGERTKAENELRQLTETLEERIRERTHTLEEQTRLQTRLSGLNNRMRGQSSVNSLGDQILQYISETFQIPLGVTYLVDEQLNSEVVATCSTGAALVPTQRFAPGEGLVGQVARSIKPIHLEKAPADYLEVSSGLGHAIPAQVLVHPVRHENTVIGILELASFVPITDALKEFLQHAEDAIGVNLSAARAQDIKETLLEETRKQAETLRRQQEELQVTNANLEEQTVALEVSRKKIQVNQETLRSTNHTLQEQTTILEQRQKELEIKAEELSAANRYKSEFLANMSHELRTPLNSMLILSQMLAENRAGHLDAKESEYARTVHQAGSELLVLINDILDLSKVESGRLAPDWATVDLGGLVDHCRNQFGPLAQEKGITFQAELADNLPVDMISDQQRLEQIIRNLMANALKFTSTGGIALRVENVEHAPHLQRLDADSTQVVAFIISDTGIGIPADKQETIFQSFTQADGTTSREYGGTGLGLSISREFTRLLGGEMHLNSEEGRGSIFTLYLPVKPEKKMDDFVHEIKKSHTVRITRPDNAVPVTGNPDNTSATSSPATRTNAPARYEKEKAKDAPDLLIVEDDKKFAQVLADLGHERGFIPIVAHDGRSGFNLAVKHQPEAILLDIHLPEMDGIVLIDHLADHPETRHIPIHAMSVDDYRTDVLQRGAIGFLEKPSNKEAIDLAFQRIQSVTAQPVRHLLIVDKNTDHQSRMVELISADSSEINVTFATSEDETIQQLSQLPFDCMILNLGPDSHKEGLNLLQRIAETESCTATPVIVYTGINLNSDEEDSLSHIARHIIVKGVHSEEHLLQEATRFLRRMTSHLPPHHQKTLRALQAIKCADTSDKTVLVVDDDSRNIFAVTHIIEGNGMEVLQARNGEEALRKLNENPTIDLVLMDIMMPGMDGYEATREIRKQDKHRYLPIIALTAKAMKNDRDLCLDAGANDYMAKPIDVDRLLSLLRVWLY